MCINWRLEFCGSAVRNLLYVSQLATGILWVRSIELALCLNWQLEFWGSAVWNLFHVSQLASGILWVHSIELALCLLTGDWNFLGPQYGACFMSPNWRLEFCGSAVWNLLYVSQLVTGILWVRSMELSLCLSTGDWNFVGPQYGSSFMSPNWRLEFCGSAVWNFLYVSQLATEILWVRSIELHVSQLATGILWVRSMELASCLPTGNWDFMIPHPPMAQHPPVDEVLIIVASRSHSDTPHSGGLLWSSDQPDAETST
jgi:hypothetical protein